MEKRLRVLHVVRQFEPSVGGLETYVSELASRQAEAFDVTVLTLDRVFGGTERLSRLERRERFTVRRIPFVGYRRLFLPFLRPGTLSDYDIVHIHAADQLLDLVSAFAAFRPAKLFMTTHGLFFHTEALARIKRAYLHTITKWSLGRCRAVFAVSGNDAATLRGIGLDPVLLRNPIVPLGDIVCSGPDLLYVGRLAENKRVDALVAFMAKLRDRLPGSRLHIVGRDGDGLWPALSKEVGRLGLDDSVRYHGFLAPEALLALARQCGFCVSASRFEGFGLSIVEGMSIGLVPCMHANEAFREIHGLSGCGILTNFDTPEQAARDFAEWAPHVGAEERAKAVRYAQAQSWDAVTETYARYYRQP